MRDHVLRVLTQYARLKVGEVADEGEVRMGLLGIIGIRHGAGFRTGVLHGLIEYGAPQRGLV